MGTTNYDKAYVKCYELVIDITKEIKDFFYPGQYSFEMLDENLPVSQKLELIKKDLESMKFEKEIPTELFKYLQVYYPVEKVLSSDIKNDELSFLFYANLQRLADEVKNKFLSYHRASKTSAQHHLKLLHLYRSMCLFETPCLCNRNNLWAYVL